MNNPFVSIVVPVYNVERYLDRCLNSLIHQSLKNIEIILVDDGSTDASPSICDKYVDQDQRIKVIHKQNEGLGMARNSGMDIAEGSYIAFVDSDDFVELDMFEKMYNEISNNNADMVISNYYCFNTEKKMKQCIKGIDEYEVIGKNRINNILFRLIDKDPRNQDNPLGMSVWKNLYSLTFLKKNKIQFCSERGFVSEDVIFHINALPLMKKIVLMPEAFYNYCDNSSQSLSSTFRISKFEEYKKLYKKELSLLKLSNIFDEGKYCTTTAFLGNIRAHIKQLVQSDLSKKDQIDIIASIVNDDLVQDTLKWYPYKLTSFSQRIFSVFIKNKNIKAIRKSAILQNLR